MVFDLIISLPEFRTVLHRILIVFLNEYVDGRS